MTTFDLPAYQVSLLHGFLPEEPLRPLRHPQYRHWEAVSADLPRLIRTRTVQQAILNLPIVGIDQLQDENDWRRAYSVLAFLAHAWIWGSGVRPNETVPPCVSIPFLAASSHFGVPPTVTYSALAMYNWTADPGSDWGDPYKIRSLSSFTGLEDEEWFYMISVAIEQLGAPCIELVLQTMGAIQVDDADTVLQLLRELAPRLRDVSKMLDRVYDHCRPEIFYNQMRPFWAGAKGMGSVGLPRGIYYNTGDGKGEWHVEAGGSAAQSPLFHFLDAALSVEHRIGGKADTKGTLDEMRRLIPKPHRDFIQDIEQQACIKEYTSKHGEQWVDAYNTVIGCLSDFRNRHIRIAARYILTESRRPTSAVSADAITLSTANLDPSYGLAEEAKGTGGTPFMTFLKESRDETRASAV